MCGVRPRPQLAWGYHGQECVCFAVASCSKCGARIPSSSLAAQQGLLSGCHGQSILLPSNWKLQHTLVKDPLLKSGLVACCDQTFCPPCCRELQQVWSKDSFLKSGGTARNSRRPGEKFQQLFSACHAAEDRLKGLTLKHDRAVRAGAPKTRQQQENIVPTAKRRDGLR